MRIAIGAALSGVFATCSRTPKPAQPTEPSTLDARTLHVPRRAIDDPNTGAIEGHASVDNEPLVETVVLVSPMRRPVVDPTLTLPDLIATPETPVYGFVRITDSNANYVVDALQAGAYNVTVLSAYFAMTVTNVDVAAGFATHLDLAVHLPVPAGETVRTALRSRLDDSRLAN
jgi:hypothetical protein